MNLSSQQHDRTTGQGGCKYLINMQTRHPPVSRPFTTRPVRASLARFTGASLATSTSGSATSKASSTSFERTLHTSPDGVKLELVSLQASKGSASKSPLLFVHGSYHGAWCWQEHFMPYFAERGHDCWALSLRCQGGSERVEGLKVAGTLDSLTADIASVVAQLPRPPVVVAHSFGGLLMQNYALQQDCPPLAGAAFLCSAPPSGNKEMVGRFLKRDFILSMKVTWAFVGKSFARSLDACKEVFFSPDLPDADLRRYQAQLAACSPIRLLDLKDMTSKVPLPKPKTPPARVFVLGGEKDCIVDTVAVHELADYYGVKAVVLPNMAHDCMLDTRWKEAAEALVTWLDAEGSSEQ